MFEKSVKKTFINILFLYFKAMYKWTDINTQETGLLKVYLGSFYLVLCWKKSFFTQHVESKIWDQI